MVVLRNSKLTIFNSDDGAKVFQDLLKLEDKIDQEREHLYIMHLNGRNQVKLVELVIIGTKTEAMVHPREIFRRAIKEGSVSIVLAHNHPSDEVSPSDNDIMFTRRIHEAGEIVGILLLDHIVFTPSEYYSFQKNR